MKLVIKAGFVHIGTSGGSEWQSRKYHFLPHVQASKTRIPEIDLLCGKLITNFENRKAQCIYNYGLVYKETISRSTLNCWLLALFISYLAF